MAFLLIFKVADNVNLEADLLILIFLRTNDLTVLVFVLSETDLLFIISLEDVLLINSVLFDIASFGSTVKLHIF